MTAPAEKKSTDARGSVSELTPLAGIGDRAPAGPSKAHAKELRRARANKLLFRFGLYVVLPTAAAATYYGGLATDQYESHAIFTVQSSENRPTLGMEGILAGLGTSSGNTHDAMAIRDYVLSRDMLARLDKDKSFISHYKAADVDWFSRLSEDASFEDSFEYFRHKVHANFDASSGSVTLDVRAFSAEQATSVAHAILAYSEEMVNKLSERQRRDRTTRAEADVKAAEDRLTKSRQKIVGLQQKHGDFSPLQTATSAMEIRTALEGELARARAELMQLKSFMKEDAPQVLAANEKVKSLSAQVSGENRRLVDPGKAAGLNASLADFEAAMVEKEFAQRTYESALATFELARADADRQHRYLAVIASPSKPDASTYPRRARSVLAAFVLSFLLLGVGSLVGAAIKEHARL